MAENSVAKSLNITIEEAKERFGKKYIEITRHPGERLFIESIYDDGSLSCISIDDDHASGYFHAHVKEITKIGYLEPRELWKP